jgi:hypothetical protein
LQVATLVKDEEKFVFFEKIELLGIVPGNKLFNRHSFSLLVQVLGELTDQQRK